MIGEMFVPEWRHARAGVAGRFRESETSRIWTLQSWATEDGREVHIQWRGAGPEIGTRGTADFLFQAWPGFGFFGFPVIVLAGGNLQVTGEPKHG